MKFITLVLCLALVQIVSATVISLEEGDSDTKRVFKWILDPASPAFPVPRFRVQNGANADFKEFRFLATLNCTEVDPDDVAMAIYDPDIDDWNCTSTGNLPNDTSVPSDVVTGLPHNCSRNLIAVWNHTLQEWDCSFREALVYQTEPYIPDQFCRDGDLLTINQDLSDTWINRPGGLCVASTTRQVGSEASVQLKRAVVSKNSGDPDETFFVQSTCKAVGNFSQTVAREHDKWQYWSWSPVRTGFTSSMGTYPPILPLDGLHLVTVISNTYAWSNNVYSIATIPIQFHVMSIHVNMVGTYPSISYMNFVATQFTQSAITAPGIVLYNNGTGALPNTALSKYNAFSIQISSFPASGYTSSPKNNWFAVSLWFSYITKEA